MSGLDALRSMPRDPRSSAPQRTNGRVARETCVVEIHFPRRMKDISNILYFIFYIFWVRGKMIERIVIFFFFIY